jgi:formamidopyrimidine-DNA glycosylase
LRSLPRLSSRRSIMPELAEVEFFRRRWDAGRGQRITAVFVHPRARVFRGNPAARLVRRLTGARLLDSRAAAKQMLFRFSGGRWLGVHLGMSGELRVEPAGFRPGPHDHLVLVQRGRCLIFNDPRMFGRILFAEGGGAPPWWTRLAAPILSADFTPTAAADFLRRRARTAIKPLLLMQERFPGVGNWMADEILWRAGIHPRRRAGSLKPTEIRALWRESRRVCRLALRTIAGQGRRLPPALNASIPDTWLFKHRWEDGGRCPRTGARLVREQIGGRTTCWSPGRQRL